MKGFFPYPPSEQATLVRRVNRFVAEVERSDGSRLLVHTPNTGSLLGLLEKGAPVLIMDSGNPSRKYRYSWKAVQVPGQWKEGRDTPVWVSIDTLLPNRMVPELISQGLVPGLTGFDTIRREVKVEQGTRLDLVLEGGDGPCFVEIKNVTLVREGIAQFPDAVTSRGLKHLEFLRKKVQEGACGAVVFTVQREDGEIFKPAWDIDPAYSRAFVQALEEGVRAIPLLFSVSPEGVRFLRSIDVDPGA